MKETFHWTTEHEHANNTETMSVYLECYLPDSWDILEHDGAYALIEKDGVKLGVHASGNGDFFNHKVEFEPFETEAI